VAHEIDVAAAADTVYGLVADVTNWPRIFPPTVYVDRVDGGEGSGATEERIRIWATANGTPKNWTSRRRLDPAARRIEFRQERSSAPVASMGGAWIIEETGPRSCHVRLLHDYRAVDDHPRRLEWIDKAVDRNSKAELAALKYHAELDAHADELTLSFTDSVRVNGSAKDVYDFINEAGAWRERLPHVASVRLREESPGLQVLRMDTLTKDGDRHTTESVRVCFPHHRIVYKQTTLPALMALHTGYWQFDEGEDGVTTATSQHTVVVNAEAIPRILGEDAGVPEARAFLREALGNNSRTTLNHAKDHAERRR
jgi:aromatase